MRHKHCIQLCNLDFGELFGHFALNMRLILLSHSWGNDGYNKALKNSKEKMGSLNLITSAEISLYKFGSCLSVRLLVHLSVRYIFSMDHGSDRYQRGTSFSFYSLFSFSVRNTFKMAEMCKNVKKSTFLAKI